MLYGWQDWVPDGMITAHANQARIMQFPQKYKDGGISSEQWEKLYDTKVNTIYAADVIEFAKNQGYFAVKDSDFSFSDVYNPVDFGGTRFCEARVWSMFRQVNGDMEQYEQYAMGYDLKNRMPLFIKPDKKISLKDMFDYMGDHYEGTNMDFRFDCGGGPFEMLLPMGDL
ncbi:MAG: C69 family dipeptidase [Saprospiraceae bacterium]